MASSEHCGKTMVVLNQYKNRVVYYTSPQLLRDVMGL